MINRRGLLRGGIAATTALATAPVFDRRAWAAPRRDEADRILVVVELSGGNDGLNTVVPYGDDAYYRQRPTIGIKADELLKLDGDFGFNPGMLGFERLWRSEDLAIVHGCGYEQPSYSHFTSMAYWHTGVPGGGDEFGWLGRLADAMDELGKLAEGVNTVRVVHAKSAELGVYMPLVDALHRLLFDGADLGVIISGLMTSEQRVDVEFVAPTAWSRQE